MKKEMEMFYRAQQNYEALCTALNIENIDRLKMFYAYYDGEMDMYEMYKTIVEMRAKEVDRLLQEMRADD